MKSFLMLAIALSVALPLAADAKDSDEEKWKKRAARAEQRAASPASSSSSSQLAKKFAVQQRNFSNAGAQQNSFRSIDQSRRRAQLANSTVNVQGSSNFPALNSNTEASARIRSGGGRNWQANKAQWQASQANVESSASSGQGNQRNWQGSNRNWHGNDSNWQGNNNRNWESNNNRNWQGNQRNWHGRNRASLYADSLRHRRHHNRDWWRRHFTRFVLVNGGYWYWNSGFWYPAWGYDSAYNSYAYDGPIYGYNDLLPHQVVANVQIELQRRGYYHGEVDGDFGPMTQEALANYQADHGLQVSATVDRQTLRALGLA